LGLSYDYPSEEQEEPFHIASIGKVFTASLISILAEREEIALDAPIINYLPDTPMTKGWVSLVDDNHL
jgi:D-alanyl-D-alanine carboxypeptidase